jgi:signal transduction histidine kinase
MNFGPKYEPQKGDIAVNKMLENTKQHGKSELLNAYRFQKHISDDPAEVRRLKEAGVPVIGTIIVSARSQSPQENISTIDWLSTSILHDLRNPLSTIYAGAEILMDLDPAPTQVKRLAANIYRAAATMWDLVADLTSVARGKRLTAEILDIREVITTASEAASAASGNQSVEILLDVPGKIELPLIRSCMERVFFNLVINALEAMPSGGRVHIGARKAGNCVLIDVEDTGPGIPRGIRDRLFEPFVTTGKQDGLGLGLALSRQTVLNHGGDIWLELAVGARFVIRLPVNRDLGSSEGRARPESVV